MPEEERVMGVAEMVEDAYLDELADRMERAAEVGVTVHISTEGNAAAQFQQLADFHGALETEDR